MGLFIWLLFNATLFTLRLMKCQAAFPDIVNNFHILFNNTNTLLSDVYFKVQNATSKDAFTLLWKDFQSFTGRAEEFINELQSSFDFMMDASAVRLEFEHPYLESVLPIKSCLQCFQFNETAFETIIKSNLYGQHLVEFALSKYFQVHLKNPNPAKALVMSFQGQTGCGKSFLSRMILDNLFQKCSFKHAHLYIGSLDFSNADELEKYQIRLLSEISLLTRICPRSIFIFDDVNQIVPGVLDVLKILMSNHDTKENQIDFRGTTFIFLSNFGKDKIAEVTYERWLDGIAREELNLSQLEDSLKLDAFNTPGGLYQSQLIKENFIDVYVPFLPMERSHIRKCILKYINSHNLTVKGSTIDFITSQLEYYPSNVEIFSVSGCKRISHKVDLYKDKI